MIRIALATTSPPKIAAVERFARWYLGPSEIRPIATESGVSRTPMDDEEAIRGCENRIRPLRASCPDYDYLIGLEGTVRVIETVGAFVCGWALIEDVRRGRRGYGASGKVQLPAFIAGKLSRDGSLAAIVEESYPGATAEAIGAMGANGVVTRGVYCRADEFFDALRCAHGYLANEGNHVASAEEGITS